MDGSLYFEEQPWNRACTLIREQKHGRIHQIVLQCVCEQGRLEEELVRWKDRIHLLAGEEQDGDLLKGGHTISYIGTYGDQTIVRIFLDDGASDVSQNFEIVTDRSLVVWKPINTNQGHLLAEGCSFIESRQQYVQDLQSRI